MSSYLREARRKTAVVTGAGSGLGRALALDLGGRGWTVGIVDINMVGAQATLDLVEKAGAAGGVFHCDVRDLDQVTSTAQHFFDEWGGVGLLVNNAGVAAGGFVGDIDMDDWMKVIDTNLWGTIHGCHAFIPRMKAQGGGHIANVASFAGIMCLPEMAPYNVAKAAVISLSETLRSELAPDRIGITVACPSFFETNLIDDMPYTDEFQIQFARAAFTNAKVSSGDIAHAILKAVDRNKLYVFPQFASKWTRVSKGIAPSVHYGVLAWLCRTGRSRPLIMWMARRGWV